MGQGDLPHFFRAQRLPRIAPGPAADQGTAPRPVLETMLCLAHT